MKRGWWVVLVVLVLGLGAIVGGTLRARFSAPPEAGLTVVRDGVTVVASLRPDPPAQRGTVLGLHLARDGVPVHGAHVLVEAVMPQMGAMPEMRSAAEVTERAPGAYEATFDLPMGGTWSLEVTAHTADGPVSLRLGLTVGAPGLSALDGDAPAATADAPPPSADAGTPFALDAGRRARFGIRTAPVTSQTVPIDVRAPGTVVFADDRRSDVVSRTDGWVEEVLVDRTGVAVAAGQTLLRVASPELLAAEQELLVAARAGGDLLDATRARLRLLGLTDADVDGVLARGSVDRRVPIRAPAAGVVLTKAVVLGDRVEPGAVLYTLAPAGAVWIEADVAEIDLGRVAVGDAVVVALAAPGDERPGRVTLVGPEVDPGSRRGRVRLVVDDPTGLRPGMLATVRLHRDVGPVLTVPDTAVVFAGDARYVFVDLGDGRLQPRRVGVGARGGGRLEITSGLAEGDAVVATGVFLVAAESRLQDALPGWDAP